MKTTAKLSLLYFVFGLFLIGCENVTPLNEDLTTDSLIESGQSIHSDKGAGENARTTSLELAGFQVDYQGQSFDGSQTTFSYLVTGPAEDMHFRLELPDCAPQDPTFNPSNGTSNNNDEFINPGVEWHPSVGSGTSNSFTFEVTYPGFVKEGIVLVSVKSNSTTEFGEIAGACARVFDINGSVYTDANDNSLLDNSETGIGGATLNLLDDLGNVISSTVSESDGAYLFEGFPEGDYSVMIDTNSVVTTATTYLEAILPVSLDISLGPDSFDNNFGFEPKTSQIIDDLKFKDLLTNGETSKFWKDQFKVAVTGNGKAEIDENTLISYVELVRELQLLEVYPLEGGDGLQATYDILNIKAGNSDVEKLRIELLAAELNHVAGLGIIGTDPELQLVLIGWGESLLFAEDNPESLNGKQASITSRTASSLEDAIDVFGSINKSSGGGGAGN